MPCSGASKTPVSRVPDRKRLATSGFTPEVLAAQRETWGRSQAVARAEFEPLTAVEREFIAARDSFYMATVNRDGWPYLQHRGGEPGFLRVLDDRTLAFADRTGNRQLVSVGNLAGNDRAALFLMDYPGRRRLKILGRAGVRPIDEDSRSRLYGSEEPPDGIERVFFVDVAAYDWNCPKYITPRYDAAEVEARLAPYERRIEELEAALAARTRGQED